MATIQQAILSNNASEWNENKRYRVGQSVFIGAKIYQNTTGKNSNPEDLTDWVLIDLTDTPPNLEQVLTEGNIADNSLTLQGADALFKVTDAGENNILEYNPISGNLDVSFPLTSWQFSEDKITRGQNGFQTDLTFTDPTANRSITFQDDDGTVAFMSDVQNQTGWEQITDSTYTLGSPLTILSGVTGKILTGTVAKIQTQLPSGVSTFWNETTDKLLGVNNGDSFTLSLRFKAKMSVVSGIADVAINIGGAFNVISQETILFYKGANTEQRFDIDLSYFTGTTFISNGGDIQITPLNGDIEIYDIVLSIFRTHKGK